MLDVPHVVVLDVSRNLNQVPSCLNQLPNSLNQLPNSLNQLPSSLNQLPSYLNQLPNCLNQLPSYLNQLPSCLNLPGSVRVVVNCSLLLDMLDAQHAVVVVPNLSPKQLPLKLFPSCELPVMLFLPHRVSPNVILAAFRCRLATILPAVWNAGIAEGTCRTDLRHWLLW